MISAIVGLILPTGLSVAFAQPVDEAHKQLLGVWMATDAKSDGKAAQDGRPTAFEAKAGSGYVLITFQRAKF